MKIKISQLAEKIDNNVKILQVSSRNNGNVTMVIVVVENSQNLKAVDLQRRTSCEMQLNVVVNVHVAVHSSTFQHNKMCMSLSEHRLCTVYS